MENEITNIIKLRDAKLAQAARIQYVLHVRNAIAGALVCIIISAVLSFVFSVAIIPGAINLKSIVIPSGSYILLGILFVVFFYSKLYFLSKENYGSGIIYSFVVFACVFSAAFAIGVIKGNSSVITCIYYSCLFLLPFAIYQTWVFYDRLSLTDTIKIWYFPEHTSHIPSATVFLNSIRIKIKVAPVYGTTEEIYETTVPGRISVGTMFNDFVIEESETGNDKFKDTHNQPFGWQFFAPSFMGLGTRRIDADLSLDQNKIKNNTLIIARRISK